MIPIFLGNIVNISTGLCSFKMCDTVFKEMSCLGDPAVCLRDGVLEDQLGGGGGDSKNQSPVKCYHDVAGLVQCCVPNLDKG